jgi:transcriptional regulator with XRE-family HTH domain
MPRTTTSAAGSQIIGRAVRQARQEDGLTQNELAGRLSVSAPYIANVEAGRENLTIGQITAIAEALGRGVDIALRAIARERIELPDRGVSATGSSR